MEYPNSIPWSYTEILNVKSMNADWTRSMQNMREMQDRMIYETLKK